MLDIVHNNSAVGSFLSVLGSDWCLYNINSTKDNNVIIYKIASSDSLSGTIQLKLTTDDILSLHTTILTDREMYEDCLDLVEQFKGTENKFIASSNFFSDFGGNGTISVKIVVCDENIEAIYKVMKMVDFKEKL